MSIVVLGGGFGHALEARCLTAGMPAAMLECGYRRRNRKKLAASVVGAFFTLKRPANNDRGCGKIAQSVAATLPADSMKYPVAVLGQESTTAPAAGRNGRSAVQTRWW